MNTKFIIRDLPVIKSNTNFNYLGIRNRCITREMVQAIAAGLNKIYDEQGDDASTIDIEMLSRASGIRPETLRGNCKSPTGAKMICGGVFIREIAKVLIYTNSTWKMERTDLKSSDNLEKFISELAKWCYDPVMQEIIKLLTRGANLDYWYLAFEPVYDLLLPDRELFFEESKQRQNHKLAALFASDFAEWARIGFKMKNEEEFKQGIKDDITYMRSAVEEKMKQKM